MNGMSRMFLTLAACGFATTGAVAADGDRPSPEHLYHRILHFLHAADADHNHEVTLEEIQALHPTFTQYAFDYIDRNDDGVISRADLPAGPPPGPWEMLVHLLRMADADNDGAVTFEELAALVPEVTEEQFDRLDRNDDGVISRADLPPFPNDGIERLIRLLHEADADGDHRVTYEELLAVFPEFPEERFARLDRNGDGVLSIADLPKPPIDPLRRLLHLLHEADADENGEVTFEELQAVFPGLTEELFHRLDRNGDGVISRADLPAPPEDPRDRLLRLLREADTNGDHALTFEELAAVVDGLTQERFDSLDRNGDGVLSRADLPDGPIPPDDLSRRELLRALCRADGDRDGALSFEEIAEAFPSAPAELLEWIDLDGDEIITRAELRDALQQAYGGGWVAPPADVDVDGALNARDIQIIINHALGLRDGLLLGDLDGDDAATAVDVQTVINGVLGIN